MGATGLNNSASAYNGPYTMFDSYTGSQKWFNNPDLSNSADWVSLLTPDELKAIKHYTGSSYDWMNELLYNKNWDDLTDTQKKKLADVYNAINKFELKKGISVTRQTSTAYLNLGLKDGASADEVIAAIKKNPNIQFNGFLSSGANEHGVTIDGSGVEIHFKLPPGKGIVAYVDPISMHKGPGENEALINNNSVFHFDYKSVKTLPNGKIYVEAYWLGQAKKQKF